MTGRNTARAVPAASAAVPTVVYPTAFAAVPAAAATVPTVVPAVVPTASTAVPMAVLPGVVLPGVVLPGAVPQTPVPADPLEAMRNLKAMLDGGMIDPDEYEAKKSELMARM